MGYIEDFKKFAVRGNVVDLAIAVVIGGAFGKIVTSFVNDIIMPPLGLLLGGVNFNELSLTLKKATVEAEAVTLNYGTFIQVTIDFLIIAVAIFVAIKFFEQFRQKRKEEEKNPESPIEPPEVEQLLTEIRDVLKESHTSQNRN
ncbi:MAG: large-conductance mechanosensitive channel protein MscL [Bacteroidetes bacterium]|jgi:large conductance mechanosensitive channel|nr:large-conductance mechanosensitive channel protein MscL [Bacteroidota bacterium]